MFLLLLFLCFSMPLSSDELPSYCFLSFKDAHCGAFVSTDARWIIVEKLYMNHVYKNSPVNSRVRIPKIIHQIWLGSPVPERYVRLQKTFQDKHPDWRYILWTDAMIEEFHLTNFQAYTASTNYGEKSDIARYEILFHMGGLYADLDVECCASFDYLHHACDFYAGVSPLSKTVMLENCIIGCCPGHPIMKHCIERLMRKDSQNISYIHAITQGTGPVHLTNMFFRSLKQARAQGLISIALPALFFFSPDIFKSKIIKKMPMLALHYWEGSWQAPEHRWHASAWKNYGTRFQ